jgi:hypothetical protein
MSLHISCNFSNFKFQIWSSNWNLIVHQSQGATSCMVDVQSQLDMSTNHCHDASWHFITIATCTHGLIIHIKVVHYLHGG